MNKRNTIKQLLHRGCLLMGKYTTTQIQINICSLAVIISRTVSERAGQ